MSKPVVVKAEYLADVACYRVFLKPGSTYLVGGIEIKPHGDVWRDPAVGYEVESLKSVRVAQEVLDQRGFYSFGEDKLTHEDYFQRLHELQSKAFEDHEDEEVVVVLDKETYHEFLHLRDAWVWNPDTLKLTWVEPQFEVDLSRLKSEDPYVYSAKTSVNEPYIWEYDQAAATAAYVSECFTRLGMTRSATDSAFSSLPEGSWDNSSHSHLRFVRAFGKYLFAEDHVSYGFLKDPRFYKGSLEDMLARSRADKEFIERRIISAYEGANGSRRLKENEVSVLLKDLHSILHDLKSVRSAKGTGEYLSRAKEKIRDRITALENILVEEHLDARK